MASDQALVADHALLRFGDPACSSSESLTPSPPKATPPHKRRPYPYTKEEQTMASGKSPANYTSVVYESTNISAAKEMLKRASSTPAYTRAASLGGGMSNAISVLPHVAAAEDLELHTDYRPKGKAPIRSSSEWVDRRAEIRKSLGDAEKPSFTTTSSTPVTAAAAGPPPSLKSTKAATAPEIRNARGCTSASMPGSPEGALTREEPVGHGRPQHQNFRSILASIDAVHL